MRCGIAALICFGLLACSPQPSQTVPEAPPEATSSEAPDASTEQASVSSRPASFPPDAHLDLSCDNPLYALAEGGATVEDLRAALGESNVVWKSDYDAVWVALYPGDPIREIAVEFDSAGRVLFARTEYAASAARLGGALRMGDDLAAVQRFSGAPLPLDGNFLQSFVVADDPDSPCQYSVNVRTEAPGDRSNGTGSTDPAAQPPGLRVSALHISRRLGD